MSFAHRLHSLRENRRLSKSALARKVGVTTTCVWNWEEGNTEPRSLNLRALAEALNAPMEYLESGVGWEDARSSSVALERWQADLTLPEVISDAKIRIAGLAGIVPEKVNISLDY